MNTPTSRVRLSRDPVVSYVMTTFNKLPFLREAMERLLSARGDDEEIVVADGGSTDGSAEYLGALKADGLIDRYIAERDFGEAHGWNKAALAARGELIKLVTDDDCYSFEGVRACREHMGTRKDVDVLLTPAVNTDAARPEWRQLVCAVEDGDRFERHRLPMNTCWLGMMLRRASLPLVGLANTSFVWVDFEYMMRVFHSPCTITCTSFPVVVRLGTCASNSDRFRDRIWKERARVEAFYASPTPVGLVDRARGVKQQGLRVATEWRRRASAWLSRGSVAEVPAESVAVALDARAMFALGDGILAGYRGNERRFYTSPGKRS